MGLTRVELVTSPLSGLRRGFSGVRVRAETRSANAISFGAVRVVVAQMAHRMAHGETNRLGYPPNLVGTPARRTRSPT